MRARLLISLFAIAVPLLADTMPPVETAWKILTDNLHSSNPLKRKQAVAALSLLSCSPRGVEMAMTALGDSDPEVREMAASVLGEMKIREAIPKLQAALGDKSGRVRLMAARSLWMMDDRSGREVMTKVLANDEPNNVGGMFHDEVRDAKKKLRNPSELATMGVKEGAGALLGPFSFGIMVFEEIRKDGSLASRAVAASQLATDTDPATLQALLNSLLNDRSWVVRVAAAKAIAQRASVTIIPTIAPALQDKHDAVQDMVATAIIKLDTEGRPHDVQANVQPATVPIAAAADDAKTHAAGPVPPAAVTDPESSKR